jgi:hypothetical protein
MHRSPIQSISQLSRDISIPQAYLIKILQQIHDPPSHLFLSQSRARCIASHRRYRCGRVCYSRGDEGGSDSSPYGRLRCSCAGLREASCGSKESGAEHLVGVDDVRRVLEICLNYSSFSENIGLEALLRNGNSRDLDAWAAFRTTSAFRRVYSPPTFTNHNSHCFVEQIPNIYGLDKSPSSRSFVPCRVLFLFEDPTVCGGTHCNMGFC